MLDDSGRRLAYGSFKHGISSQQAGPMAHTAARTPASVNIGRICTHLEAVDPADDRSVHALTVGTRCDKLQAWYSDTSGRTARHQGSSMVAVFPWCR